jgi:S1-C subfamily serine protease
MKNIHLEIGIALICWTLLASGCTCSAPSASLVSRTVSIESTLSHGSGVALNDRTVLTAQHVVLEALALGDPNISVRDTAGHVHTVVGCILDQYSDAAVLFVSPRLDTAPPCLISHARGLAGTAILCVGAPRSARWFPCATWGRISCGSVPALPMWPMVVIVDAHIAPGCSGGPVFLRGRLYGICVGTWEGLGLVLPVSELYDLLHR